MPMDAAQKAPKSKKHTSPSRFSYHHRLYTFGANLSPSHGTLLPRPCPRERNKVAVGCSLMSGERRKWLEAVGRDDTPRITMLTE